MPIQKTPGIYIEEKGPTRSVAQVETAIPAFIGVTHKIPANGCYLPVKIQTFEEYEQVFGAPEPRSYEVRVQRKSASKSYRLDSIVQKGRNKSSNMHASIRLYFLNGGKPCYVIPLKTPTAYLKGLKACVSIDEITIISMVDAANLSPVKYSNLVAKTLIHCKSYTNRFAIFDIAETDLPKANVFKTKLSPINLKYGAAYLPLLDTKLRAPFAVEKVSVLEKISDTSKIKKHTLKKLQAALPELYRFVMDALEELPGLKLYPGPLIAGIFCKVDDLNGVWKAPANVELYGINKPVVLLTNSEQETLNIDPNTGISINAIRFFQGMGTVIWGSRTLAGNDNEWRYISVVRTISNVKKSIENSIEYVVFEPNDQPLWNQIRAMIENHLYELWKAGAFAGSKPEEAYFVQVGLGQTMTQIDVSAGKLIIKIGLAMHKPAEFTVIELVKSTAA